MKNSLFHPVIRARLVARSLGFLFAVVPIASAQLVVTRVATPNVAIPDGGEAANAMTMNLGGATVQNVQVGFTLANAAPSANGPAFNGDFYATLGHGTGFAVLLNRTGVTASNATGYGDNGFNVTFDDAATNGDIHNYRTTLGGSPTGALTGRWAPDGRNVDPSVVNGTEPRSALLSSFNGLNSDGEWRLFVSDENSGGAGVLSSWSLRLVVQPSGTAQMQFADTELSASSSAQTVANPIQFTGASKVLGNYDITLQGALSGSGTLTKEGTSRLVLNNPDSYAGAFTVAGGTVDLPAGFGGSGGAILVGAAGTLTGHGDIGRTLINQGAIAGPAVGSGQFLSFSGDVSGAGSYSGRIAMNKSFSPGNSPAVVTITGDLKLGSTNLLTMEIGGTTPGTGYDQLQVSNTLTFGGTLTVSLVSGFTPSDGDSYRLFNAGTYASTFSTQNLAALPPNLQWDFSGLNTTGVLSVAAIPEPATVAWWSGGAALVFALVRRRKKKVGAARDLT